ncbi:hypothetical protein IGI04_023457 [Brassica rapa subsp. trilocularis]|uniref:Uncharacterized protein n=1 Tax=Brassica rapa subsp. trilocularis TaxID=1813537 RepID=A0ABQ7M7B1_BRACM|nr:hypothetical protein IGI04_023457 [Brassica rapa subsp. trilocularis]
MGASIFLWIRHISYGYLAWNYCHAYLSTVDGFKTLHLSLDLDLDLETRDKGEEIEIWSPPPLHSHHITTLGRSPPPPPVARLALGELAARREEEIQRKEKREGERERRILTRSDTNCNGPIPRRLTGVIEGALWTRVYSFRQPCVSRYWSRESTGAKPSLKYRHTHIHILLLIVLRIGKWKWRSEQQWVAPTRLLPHILVDWPHLLWVLPYSCGFATSPMDT